jgi:hypothetical protein
MEQYDENYEQNNGEKKKNWGLFGMILAGGTAAGYIGKTVVDAITGEGKKKKGTLINMEGDLHLHLNTGKKDDKYDNVKPMDKR